MFRESLILLSLIITGVLCGLYEYDLERSPQEYMILKNMNKHPLQSTTLPINYDRLPENSKLIQVGERVHVLQTVTISRYGHTGLLFTIESSRGSNHYMSEHGHLVPSWLKFEFEPEETLLTIHLANTNPHNDENVEITVPVFFSPDLDDLRCTHGVIGIILLDSQPATVEEIDDLIQQNKRTALLNIDWIPRLMHNDRPLLLEESDDESDDSCITDDEYDGKIIFRYFGVPIVVDKNILEKLLELKNHLQE